MLVNISRSKSLINKSRAPRKLSEKDRGPRCNHCGGAFKLSGDMVSCIMCSREKNHICDTCTHASENKVEESKKSA